MSAQADIKTDSDYNSSTRAEPSRVTQSPLSTAPSDSMSFMCPTPADGRLVSDGTFEPDYMDLNVDEFDPEAMQEILRDIVCFIGM